MSGSSRQLLALIGTVALSGQGALAAHKEEPDTARLALELMRLAYPELVTPGLELRVVSIGEWPRDVRWFPTVVVSLDKSPRAQGDHFLELTSAFDIYGRVHRAEWKGTYLRLTKMKEMIQFGEAHATLSDEDLAAELKRRGAAYGPADDLGESPFTELFERLEPIIGRITQRDIDFPHRLRGRPDTTSMVYLKWRIHLDTVHPDGNVDCYLLTVEPFAGRLVKILQC